MDLRKRHEGHHGDEDEGEEEKQHGHGHASEDSIRQHALASLYWYTLATVLVLAFIGRLISLYTARQRIRRRNAKSEAFTSVSAVERLLQGPRAIVSIALLSRYRPAWFATLPLKKASAVVVYTAFVAFLVTYKSIQHDGNFYERIAFRAGWITVTQTAFPFLLAARYNPIGLVLGTSYERINWFHRWASRVFIATATVHGSFFVIGWIQADFFWEELRTVKMVIPGLAAWIVLVWTLVSSFLPLRRWNYEFFVFQHIFSVALLLVLLFLHVPEHHLFSVWCAAAAYAYDVVTRIANPLWRNIRLQMPSGVLGRASRIAHKARAVAVDDDLTVITIPNVGFTWSPGQHVLIWAPRFWRQSPHPFTICSVPGTQGPSDIQLALKTKAGLTRKLNDWARHTEQAGGDGSLRLLITGPFGVLPNWRQFDSLVFIASSTGGSFTTPVLEDLLASQSPGCVRRIGALYIVRSKAHVEPYLQRLSRVLSRAQEVGISVRIEVAITQSTSRDVADLAEGSANESRERLIASEPAPTASKDSVELDRFSLESSLSSASDTSDRLLKEEMDLAMNDGYELDSSLVSESEGRPDVAAFTRTAVGNVPGNVAVAVCGGRAIERVVEMTVAALRRQRVVDGSSAQDLVLHMERSES